MKLGTRTILCQVIAAAIGCVIVTPVIIMATDTRPCLTFSGARFTPESARPGDVVTMTYSAREHLSCGGTVTRRFVDSANVVHTTVQEATKYHEVINKQEQTFSVQITIPLMPPGPATYVPIVYRWRNHVQAIWPLRDVSVPQVPIVILRP